MFIWNDPELKMLKQRTAGEPRWRRVLAIILALIFIIVAGFTGAVLGISTAILFKEGLIVTSLNELMSYEPSKIHIIATILPMAVLIPLSVIIWEYVMRVTNIVSKNTVRRIKRFGPY